MDEDKTDLWITHRPPLSTESRGLFVEYGQEASKTAAVLPAKSRGEPRKTLSDKPLEYVQNAAKNAYSL